MSFNSYGVILLPVKILWNSTDAVRGCLYEVINRGYDKARYKYQIILTPRISSLEMFFSDLGFQVDSDRCFLYLLSRKEELPYLVADFYDTFEKICLPAVDGITFYQPCVEHLSSAFDASRILAIIGYKPASETTFEITGFTSLAKNCGALLANNSLLHLKEHFSPEKLVAHVVVDHELVGYYENVLGFREIGRFLFDVDGRRSFEQGIKVSRNFHIAKLEKVLHYNI